MSTDIPQTTALAWVPRRGVRIGPVPPAAEAVLGGHIGAAAAVRDYAPLVLAARALTTYGLPVALLPERAVIRRGDLLPAVAGSPATAGTMVLGAAVATGADRELDAAGCRDWEDLVRAAVAAHVGELSATTIDDLISTAAADPCGRPVARVLPPDGAGLDAWLHPLAELRAGVLLPTGGLPRAAVARVVEVATDLSGSETLVLRSTARAFTSDAGALATVRELIRQLPARTPVQVLVETGAAERSDDAPPQVIDDLRAAGARGVLMTSDIETAAVLTQAADTEVPVVLAGTGGDPLVPAPEQVETLRGLDARRLSAVLDPAWVLTTEGSTSGHSTGSARDGSVGAQVRQRGQELTARAAAALAGELPRPEVVDVLSDVVLLDPLPDPFDPLTAMTGTATLWWSVHPAAHVDGTVLPLPAPALGEVGPEWLAAFDLDGQAPASAVWSAGLRPTRDSPVLHPTCTDAEFAASRWVQLVEDSAAQLRAAAPTSVARVSCQRALARAGDDPDPASPMPHGGQISVLWGATRAAVCDPAAAVTVMLSRAAGQALTAYLRTVATSPGPAPGDLPHAGREKLWQLLHALRQRGIAVPLIPRPAPDPDPAVLAFAEDAAPLQLYRDEGAGIWGALPLTGFPDEQRWVNQITQQVGTGARVLELLAGSARLGVALAAAGHQVTSVDREPAMVAQAQQRRAESAAETAGRLDIACADATRMHGDQTYDAVLIGETSLSLLPRDQLPDLFRVARAHLRPTGTLAFDYVSGDVPPTDVSGAVEPVPTRSGHGHLLASERVEAPLEGLPTTVATWVWQRPDGTSAVSTDRHRRWTREVLSGALRDAGFDPGEVTTPPDSLGDPRPVRMCLARPAQHPGAEQAMTRDRGVEPRATDDQLLLEVPA